MHLLSSSTAAAAACIFVLWCCSRIAEGNPIEQSPTAARRPTPTNDIFQHWPSGQKRSPEEFQDSSASDSSSYEDSDEDAGKRTQQHRNYYQAILSRRSALDKNFMRFGRTNGGMERNFLRFGRGDINRNFMRFGRSQYERDMERNFLRFGRRAVPSNDTGSGSGSSGGRMKRSIYTGYLDDNDWLPQREQEDTVTLSPPPFVLYTSSAAAVPPYYVYAAAPPNDKNGVQPSSEYEWEYAAAAVPRSSVFPVGWSPIFPPNKKRTWGNIDNNFIRFGR